MVEGGKGEVCELVLLFAMKLRVATMADGVEASATLAYACTCEIGNVQKEKKRIKVLGITPTAPRPSMYRYSLSRRVVVVGVPSSINPCVEIRSGG